MKKRALSLVLSLVICLTLLPIITYAKNPTQEQVYKDIIAMKSNYPEGMSWTNGNCYRWNGGGIFSVGCGCMGFAFLLSDAAFGDLPARHLPRSEFDYSDVRVGDILRVNDDSHSVIVLEVYENNIIIAEGNYNESIHWGRSLSRQEVINANYLLTRYPQQSVQPTMTQAMPTNDKLTSDGVEQNATVYKINGSNYFKVRDLAAILDGTEKQFEVGYDNATKSVTATTGKSYTPQGGELGGAASASGTATVSNDTIYVDGVKIQAEVYKIGGNNYFKLRDLGKALDFYVGYEKGKGMFIDTSKPYSE